MKKTLALLLLFCLPKLMAQKATLASGGNAAGTGGTVSYSIGQLVYRTQTGTNGNINQGIQQPIEIFTLSGEEFANIKLEAIVYPNPTTSNVILKISNSIWDAMSYQLFDIHGKLLLQGKIASEETIFKMEYYPSAIYLLKVNSNTNELKTFKIIKN